MTPAAHSLPPIQKANALTRHYFLDDPTLNRLVVDENRREVFFNIAFNFTVLKIFNKIIS
jgi:hypothetical protein